MFTMSIHLDRDGSRPCNSAAYGDLSVSPGDLLADRDQTSDDDTGRRKTMRNGRGTVVAGLISAISSLRPLTSLAQRNA